MKGFWIGLASLTLFTAAATSHAQSSETESLSGKQITSTPVHETPEM